MIRSREQLKAMVKRSEAEPVEDRLIRTAAGGSGAVVLYKAIADASGGEIQVKKVDSDGVVQGDAITLQVLP